MSEASNLQSVLHENRSFPPNADIAAHARITAATLETLRAAAAKDHTGFWAELARQTLDWRTPFKTALDDTQAPNFKWFPDGTLNVSWNCLDRHLATRGDKPAILFEGEPGRLAERPHRGDQRQAADHRRRRPPRRQGAGSETDRGRGAEPGLREYRAQHRVEAGRKHRRLA